MAPRKQTRSESVDRTGKNTGPVGQFQFVISCSPDSVCLTNDGPKFAWAIKFEQFAI